MHVVHRGERLVPPAFGLVALKTKAQNLPHVKEVVYLFLARWTPYVCAWKRRRQL